MTESGSPGSPLVLSLILERDYLEFKITRSVGSCTVVCLHVRLIQCLTFTYFVLVPYLSLPLWESRLYEPLLKDLLLFLGRDVP